MKYFFKPKEFVWNYSSAFQ